MKLSKRRTVEDAAKLWIVRPDRPAGTSERYVTGFVDQFGGESLDEIDEADIYAAYVTDTKKVSTMRREIGAVQSMLNWSCKVLGIQRTFNLEKPKGAQPRLRFLEEDEVRKVIAATPEWMKPSVLALFYMGLRRGEMIGAKWLQFDDRKGELTLSTRKGGHGRVRYRRVPVHPVLGKYLTKGRADQPMFTKEDGSAWGSGPEFNRAWDKVVEAAGVPDVTPHDARRTFASMLLERDVDLRTIADLLGHTSLTLLMVYAQVKGYRRTETVNLMPDLT